MRETIVKSPYNKQTGKLLTYAEVVAKASPGIGTRGKFKLGAVLVENECKIVSAGFNQLKTHPKLAPHTSFPHLHAETHAIFRRGLDNCEGLVLYVVRIGKGGERRLAKPCEICMYFIESCGLERVYYSIDETTYGVLIR